MKLLIVEDDDGVRDTVGEYLGYVGFEVTAVSTAAEALQAGCPDLVLTDLGLPDLPGDELIVALRARHPRALVYLYTGDAWYRPNDALMACGLTPEHVFAKPFDLARLAARLKADFEACSG